MRAASAIAGIVLGLALAADARADAIPEKAKQLAERGREAHDRGEYVDAIAAFNEAYVLAPSAGLLFDLAQAYRLAGRCDDAAWMYRRYLDSGPPPEQRALAQSHLATVEKCGHGGLRVVLVPQVSDAKLVIPTPEPELTATAPVVHRSGSRDKHFAEGFAIVGGVLVATSVVFAIDAGNAASAVTAAYKTGNGKGKDIGATDSSGQIDSDFAVGLGIAGAASLAAAAVYYTLGWRAEHAIVATPQAGGGRVAMTWRF
jgi:tetratricopeptide (TPR) repeat protein